MICVENIGTGYLGGLHFEADSYDFELQIKEKRFVWDSKSFNSQETIYDLEIELSIPQLPEFIKHLDIYTDDHWRARGYSNYFVIENVSECTRIVRIEAINQCGDSYKSIELTLTPEEFEGSNPFNLLRI